MKEEITTVVNEFFEAYNPRRYAKGQVLIHAQDDPEHIYYIVSGKVKVYDISYRGDEVVLNTFSEHAFFPMSYAVNKSPNSYFYEAETDVEIRLAPIDEVVNFIKTNPDVMFDLLRRVYSGTDGLLGRMAHLMASSARSRVLYELLIELRRFGQVDGKTASVQMNESDIGARAGLARETVNREVQKLKTEKLIKLSKNEITILDPARLEELIGRGL
jgi:CRP/FNR family transcriptional regulator